MSETKMITLPFTQMTIKRGLLFVAKLPYAETTQSRPAPTIGHPVDK